MSLENKIRKSVSLSPMTSFKIGGLADLFFEVEKEKDLIDIFDYIKKNKINHFILGGGSNIVFNDNGFRGIVLRMNNTETDFKDTTATVGAGKKITELTRELKDRSLSGLEWAYGIPATIGGLVVGNGGAFGQEISDCVLSVKVFDINKNKFSALKKNECCFDYRDSIFKQNKELIVWEISLILKQDSPNEIEEKMIKNINYRKNHQPIDYPSAGSFFKNIKLDSLKKEDWNRLIKIIGKSLNNEEIERVRKHKAIPIGLLIDLLDLKGKKIGGAEISTKHGNFLINKKNAKAEEVIILSSIIKQKIRHKFNLQVYEEIEYVGF